MIKDTAQFKKAFEASVPQIRQRFIARAEQQMADLDDLMQQMESCPSDSVALEAATNLVHKIAGVAATLGFQRVGELAQCAESRLLACAQPSNETIRAQAMAAVDTLVAELDRL